MATAIVLRYHRHGTKGKTIVCVCFLFSFVAVTFGGSAEGTANSNDRYYYDADAILRHSIEHVFHLKDVSSRQKRDVQMFNTTTVAPSRPTQRIVPIHSPPKPQYLGVNGTGQRRNLTVMTSQRPSLIHDIGMPIPPTTTTQTPITLNESDFDREELLKDNKNLTDVKTDSHIFYNSTTYTDPKKAMSFWVDLDHHPDVKINELLSNSYRRATTVKLSFEFPFYGRYIENVTVATGGFLYTGDYIHSWLAATQYIAPLMANFDTSLSNDSCVKYLDNGTSFTVQWDRVALQNSSHVKPNNSRFTFQTTLHRNGDIVFVYKLVPLLVTAIDDEHHPVKVGLSDAYILDKTVFYVRRKTIYEYHRVAFDKMEIRNWTAIYLKALPTCSDMHDCTSCLENKLNLNCTWCPSLSRCSTGQDRNRQSWLDHLCHVTNITTIAIPHHTSQCSHIDNYQAKYTNDTQSSYDVDYIGVLPPSTSTNERIGPAPSSYVVAMAMIAVGVLLLIGAWVGYAYRHPHSSSGQLLIRYRPTQWRRWRRRGEARYTAATIHM